MKSVKVLIVEDEELYADKLEMLVDKLGYEVTSIVDNSDDAMLSIQKSAPDFILMDINIQGEYDGIELAEKIQEVKHIPILFISSLRDEMTYKRVKRTKPVGFLVKPFDEFQLQSTLELAIQNIDFSEDESGESIPLINDMLFVKSKNAYSKIQPSEIIYLEADGKYTTLFLENQRHVVRSSLIKLIERLGEKIFFQSHRNYAINLGLIEEINIQDQFVIVKGKSVPLSRRGKESLSQILNTI